MKVQTLTGHADGVKCVAISPDGHILVSAGEDGKIKFWQLNNGEAYHTLSGHQYGVKNVVFSPDGHNVVSSGGDGTIKVWSLRTGELIRTLITGYSRLDSGMMPLAITPDGKTIISHSSTYSQTVKLWDFETGELTGTLTGHAGSVKAFCIGPRRRNFGQRQCR